MKKLILGIILILLFSMAEAGNDRGGGGDPCERRVQEIRDDFSSWIRQNGPAHGGPNNEGLRFANGVTLQGYSEAMSKTLAVETDELGNSREATFIECVHHPIQVQGEEKVCRFDQYDQNIKGPKITCYYEAFLDKRTTDVDEQYRLIHHEYAGLAKLELPDGSKSKYPLSNQISAHLENQMVRKLAIKPETQIAVSADENDRISACYAQAYDMIFRALRCDYRAENFDSAARVAAARYGLVREENVITSYGNTRKVIRYVSGIEPYRLAGLYDSTQYLGVTSFSQEILLSQLGCVYSAGALNVEIRDHNFWDKVRAINVCQGVFSSKK